MPLSTAAFAADWPPTNNNADAASAISDFLPTMGSNPPYVGPPLLLMQGTEVSHQKPKGPGYVLPWRSLHARTSDQVGLAARVGTRERAAGDGAGELRADVVGIGGAGEPARVLERVQREEGVVRVVALGRARRRPAPLAGGVLPVLGAGRELTVRRLPAPARGADAVRRPVGEAGVGVFDEEHQLRGAPHVTPGDRGRGAGAVARERARDRRAVLEVRRGDLDRGRRSWKRLGLPSAAREKGERHAQFPPPMHPPRKSNPIVMPPATPALRAARSGSSG